MAVVLLVYPQPTFPHWHPVPHTDIQCRINIPFITITFAIIIIFFKPSRDQGQTLAKRILSLDLVGCFIFIPAVFMLLLAMQWGGERYNWSSATVIGLFVGAAVMMLLFVGWEVRKGEEAMITGKVVMRRTVIFSGLFVFCHMGSVTIATYYLPTWFQVIQGVGALWSGIRLLPIVLTQIVIVTLAGALGQSCLSPSRTDANHNNIQP